LVSVLDAYDIRDPVNVIGHCGGAATFFRTFVRYPSRFTGRNHVLHNCIIAQWPSTLDQTLVNQRSRFCVTWTEDSEHMRWCVSYKHLAQLRKQKFAQVDFYDINV
jgi:hypothetical protein